MKYHCEACGVEIKSIYHDPKNTDIRTNVGVTMDGKVLHIECPTKDTA